MDRHGLTLRQQTKIAQKLPKDLEQKIETFQQFVIKHRKLSNFELSQIGNMDETPMTFDLPSNRTVTTAGEKTVLIKTTGHEKLISQLFWHVLLMGQNCCLFSFLKERCCQRI